MEPTTPSPSPGRSLWSPAAWAALRALGFSQTYPPAVLLFEQGSPVAAIGIVEEALVKLSRWEHRGEAVTVGIRFSGGPLGTEAAILRAPHPVTAETLTRCRILSIPADRFLQVAATDAEVTSDLHHVHAQELVECFAQLGLGALSTRERLLRLSLTTCVTHANDCRSSSVDNPKLRIHPQTKQSSRSDGAAAIMDIERVSGASASFVDIVDRLLDKGIVVDAWGRVSVGGIDLITIDTHLIVAYIETSLAHRATCDCACALPSAVLDRE